MATKKIRDIKFDNKNFNKGSVKGEGLLEKSLQKFGFREAATMDKNGMLIGGNKRTAKAGELGFENAEIIKADPKKVYVLQFDDIDLNTPEGRELALALNQTAKENIVFDAEVIEAVLEPAVVEEWQLDTYQSKNGNSLKKYDVPEMNNDDNSYFNQDNKAPDKQPFILYLPNNFNTKLQKLKKDLSDEEFAEKIIKLFGV